MERKFQKFRSWCSRYLLILIVAFFVACSFALPAGAAAIDYNDYITDVRVDGDNDIVTVSLPSSSLRWVVYDSTNAYVSGTGGSFNYSFNADEAYTIRIQAPRFDYTLIPSDTQISVYYEFSLPSGAYLNTSQLVFRNYIYYLSSSGGTVTNNSYVGENPSGWLFTSSFPLRSVSGTSQFELESRFTKFIAHNGQGGDLGSIQFATKKFELVMTISSLYRLQQQTGKTNQLLNEVEKQLEAQGKTLAAVLEQQQQTNDQLGDLNNKQDQTNNKLDGLLGSVADGFASMGDKLNDLFTGGSAGDNVTGSADDFKNQLGDVEDFQAGIESDLEAGFDEVLDFSGLSSLAPAFAFIGTYVNKIWYDMDGLQIVFVLAFGIGAFLQLAQHTPRVPVLRSQDRSSRSSGGRNSNWYDPVSGRVVDGNRERGQARASRGS